MLKITGLDKLQKQLKDATTALRNLDGDLASVSFDPDDPASIEAAIDELHRVVDERVGRYANNPFVAPLIEQTKEHCRDAVIERAAAARLEGEDD